MALTAVLAVPALVACSADEPAPAGAGGGAAAAAMSLDAVVPVPAEVTPRDGAGFRLTADTRIRAEEAAADGVARQLQAALRPSTGFGLVIGTGGPENAITLTLDADRSVGRQGYELDIAADRVTLRARTGAGLFAGVQTIRQLLPPRVDADTLQQAEWVLPGGRIVDRPRFEYRGAMLDVARHFHAPDEIKAYIDLIAQYKMNHLHLHLSDDQGWRIEIEAWPELTKRAGGAGTGVDGEGPGFLTKQDYSDLVAYAAERHVTIVPEIDLPGHTNAALSTYPELNCDGTAPAPRTDTEVGYSSLCVSKEVTYRFVEDVVKEIAALTPGPYLHIGGDEAKATTDEQYGTFMKRVLPLVAKYGKTPVGWHEIAAVPLPDDAVPQYWGTEPEQPDTAAAAAAGNRILMSPANRVYLDMKYDKSTELGFDWAARIEVKDAYDWDPARRLAGVGERDILGVEAPLWSETLRTLDDIEFMAFPRLPAIAELAWSPQAERDWDTFRGRLAQQGPRWEAQGVNFYRSPQIDWK
ncbi:beta-N-acetylhexosaminidase [Spirilliplanes yamanashiensis]|uniref:beta-N-acetylhexosaminidase n=1 Tax=Spirilliplanes yamanashiensis TaxID=42233 RepID=UPI00278B611B|nr:beta-N-acetylhexosaminidase [Spirilliplanes yamanashiensis]MDP9816309.1 hexosaminidase [Spirilliplanes yamanashiensis]